MNNSLKLWENVVKKVNLVFKLYTNLLRKEIICIDTKYINFNIKESRVFYMYLHVE